MACARNPTVKQQLSEPEKLFTETVPFLVARKNPFPQSDPILTPKSVVWTKTTSTKQSERKTGLTNRAYEKLTTCDSRMKLTQDLPIAYEFCRNACGCQSCFQCHLISPKNQTKGISAKSVKTKPSQTNISIRNPSDSKRNPPRKPFKRKPPHANYETLSKKTFKNFKPRSPLKRRSPLRKALRTKNPLSKTLQRKPPQENPSN